MKKLITILLLVLMSTSVFAGVSAGLDINDGNGTSFFGLGFFLNNEQLKGLQITAGLNIVHEEMYGAQIGLVNVSGYYKGGQISLANWSGHFKGLQIALANRSENFDGAQIGLLNWAGEYTGGQIGLANFSGSYFGTKIGLLNKSDSIKGADIGLLNLGGKIDGVSIGLVNIYTEESTNVTPIGLVNIINGGIFNVAMYADTNGMMYQQLETGGSIFYTILLHGTSYDDLNIFDSRRERVWGAGVGVRYGSELVSIDGAIISKSSLSPDSVEGFSMIASIPELRLSATLNLGMLSLFGAAGADFKIYGYNDNSFVFKNREEFTRHGYVGYVPNFYAGVKIRL